TAERGLALAAHQRIEKRLGDSRVLCAGDDGHRIEHRPIRILGWAEGLLHMLCARDGVGRVNETGIDLTARNVVQRLPHILREDELWLQPLPETDCSETLLGILTDWHRLRIPDDNFRDPSVEQVGRLCDVNLRVGRLDYGEDVASK